MGPSARVLRQRLRGAADLESAQPREAVAEYEHALALTPNRSTALLGLARARAASGDHVAAANAYRRLVRNWHAADGDLPALTEARRGERESAGDAAIRARADSATIHLTNLTDDVLAFTRL